MLRGGHPVLRVSLPTAGKTGNQWMRVKAKFGYEAVASFGSKQPVLYLIQMEPAEKPAEEIVYLG